jgi:3-hydroxyisobutyrate dehydrogenase
VEGAAERQAVIADLADNGAFGAKATKSFARNADWRTEADRILATVKANKQAS